MRGCLLLFATGCIDRVFIDSPGCPVAYRFEGVAEGQDIAVDWSALDEEEPEAQAIDRLILGRLPVGGRALERDRCADVEEAYEWTETIELPDDLTRFVLDPEQVGPVGTSTLLTLRSEDIERAILLIYADRYSERLEISIPL